MWQVANGLDSADLEVCCVGHFLDLFWFCALQNYGRIKKYF